jgi:Flp pilus assembly pilin Flp
MYHLKNFYSIQKGNKFMKKPENNAAAKIGYTVTLVIVTVAIIYVIKKHKAKF